MTSILLFGILIATFAALAVTAFQRVPTRTRCPDCGRPTAAVLPPPWLKASQNWVSMRWCSFCQWEGVGRKGPELVPGRRISHDSGFHWGADLLGEDMGFEWAPTEEAPPEFEPPHHPSGFKFSAPRPPSGSSAPLMAGFRWATKVDPRPRRLAGPPPNHPSGFSWGSSTPEQTGFHFERPDRPARRSGFEWGKTPN